MEIIFRALQLKIVNYIKYRKCSNYVFRDTLLEELLEVRISNDDDEFNNFLRIC